MASVVCRGDAANEGEIVEFFFAKHKNWLLVAFLDTQIFTSEVYCYRKIYRV